MRFVPAVAVLIVVQSTRTSKREVDSVRPSEASSFPASAQKLGGEYVEDTFKPSIAAPKLLTLHLHDHKGTVKLSGTRKLRKFTVRARSLIGGGP